ncbi:MAG: hypothetical protein VX112_00790 [Pseudomonadota bacterium]|nr:hypothetical protein [Pseudomonadota bacterium]
MMEGDVIVLKTSDVFFFLENQLPKIYKPFILVSHGDESMPSELNDRNPKLHEKQKNIILKALTNSRLIHWFSVNYDQTIKHPKV